MSARAAAAAGPGAGWQSGYAGDCKSPYVGSIPAPASIPSVVNRVPADGLPTGGPGSRGISSCPGAPLNLCPLKQRGSRRRGPGRRAHRPWPHGGAGRLAFDGGANL